MRIKTTMTSIGDSAMKIQVFKMNAGFWTQVLRAATSQTTGVFPIQLMKVYVKTFG